MRKGIALLLIAALLGACILPVSADSVVETAQKEILFRDVPWGSDMDTTESLLGNFEFNRSDYQSSAGKASYYISGEYEFSRNQGTCTQESVYARDLKVAGYDVTSIYLQYIYKFPEAIANYDNCSTALYTGTYRFECVDYELAGNDLKDKLSGLYGEPVNVIKDGDKTLYSWEGANNTACAMSVTLGSYPGIELTYLTKDGDEWIDAADEAIDNSFKAQESEIYGNGDNSGL